MTDSGQHQTMKCGQKHLRSVVSGRFVRTNKDSPEQATVGQRFGLWELTSPCFKEGEYYKVFAKCTGCGRGKKQYWDNLRAGKSTGCHSCKMKLSWGRDTSEWIRARMVAAKDRCTNPNDTGYHRYGGRGIEFRFESVQAAARWIVDNLGIPERRLQIDRINNDGHYEPGNLRWATAKENVRNRTCAIMPPDWEFRQEEWPHGYRRTMDLLGRGLSREQILERARETVRKKRKHWQEIAKRLESMTS